MDFREATDGLCHAVSHEELARALGVSVATVRQARLRSNAKAHRSPPDNWRATVIKLAEDRERRYKSLADLLRKPPDF
jgi:hypothetical protein